MSKKLTKDGLVPYSYDRDIHYHHITEDDLCLVFQDNYLSHVEGKVLTLLEGIGLMTDSETRGNSIKSLVREAFWGDMHNGWCIPATKDQWDEFAVEVLES